MGKSVLSSRASNQHRHTRNHNREQKDLHPRTNDSSNSLILSVDNNYDRTNPPPNSRNDSLGSILTNLPMSTNNSANSSSPGKPGQPLDNGFPNYYQDQNSTRPRGDSIFLPPPIGTNTNYEATPQQNSNYFPQGSMAGPGTGPSRSNSIFSLLIQFPGSNGNSVSGPSTGSISKPSGQNSAGGTRSRQLSTYPQGDYPVSAQDLENYFGKESLSNLLNYNQRQSVANQNLGKKGSTGLVDMNNVNSFWEGLNSGLSGSVAGLPITNDGLNGILAGISNGSIDFTGLSNEQRRDSILKFINDQQLVQQQRAPSTTSSKTKLREDIFDKSHESGAEIGSGKFNGMGDKSNLQVPNKHLSPTSSLSSKSSVKYNDEPQSPKTSPTMFNAGLLETRAPPLQTPSTQIPSQQVFGMKPPQQELQHMYNPYQYQPMPNQPNSAFNEQYQQSPSQAPYGQSFSQFPPNLLKGNPNLMGNDRQNYSYQPLQMNQHPNEAQYIPPTATDTSLVQDDEPPTKRTRYSKKNASPQLKSLVPAQQYVKSEDGRPLLGATKVDQLMLVIQARDKGNKSTIQQGVDGSILGSPGNKNSVLPQPVDLVGGVDKPDKITEHSDGSSSPEDGKKTKRKQKNQQCPYCLKYFNQSTHLEVHVRSHIGHKPFECNYCHKRFTQGGNLRTHLRLHTGEKPFTCDICKRSFSRKGNLAAHRLTHQNMKPYECKLDNCDKSFTQLGNLKSHQNRFHLKTLNELTHKLAELSGTSIDTLPQDEKELLTYFKDLYKNSNKGIRGRGKRVPNSVDDPNQEIGGAASSVSPPSNMGNLDQSAMNAQSMNFMNSGNY